MNHVEQQRHTISLADGAVRSNRVKCNRCRKQLQGGEAQDSKRDPSRGGYVCRQDCRK